MITINNVNTNEDLINGMINAGRGRLSLKQMINEVYLKTSGRYPGYYLNWEKAISNLKKAVEEKYSEHVLWDNSSLNIRILNVEDDSTIIAKEVQKAYLQLYILAKSEGERQIIVNSLNKA